MSTAAPTLSTSSPTSREGELARRLALGAVAGPVVFALAWFVLGFVSSGYSLWGTWIAPYSAISQPISGLGMGTTAPFMNGAFVVCGLLVMAGAVGIAQSLPELGAGSRWTCAVLLGLSGLGAVVCGLFNLEKFLAHFAGFLLAAGTPIITFVVVGVQLRRLPRSRRLGTWLIVGSPLTAALLALYFVTFNPQEAGAGHGMGGLTQRVLILEIHAWFVALGASAFRRS